MELVVFQYMLMVLAQLLTVESNTVWRHTRNRRLTKDVETIVTRTIATIASTAKVAALDLLSAHHFCRR